MHAVIARCSERDCKLKLDGLSNYVVLKGEKICRDHKICDCIIYIKKDHIIICMVELKSKTVDSSEVEEKLTNGSVIALDILGRYDECMKVKFYHLVLSKRWRTSEYRVLTSRKIIVRGKKYDIIPKRCGVSLSEVVSDLK